VYTDQLPVGRSSRQELDKSDVVDGVWTPQLGGQLDQSPDEDDVVCGNHVEDDRRQRQYEHRQPRQPRHFPRHHTAYIRDIDII